MNVLVVDDNQSGRQLLADIIQSMNLDAIQAADGYEAIAKAKENLPDLLILDVNMPGMPGFEVVQELKRDSRTAAIPILMLTALDTVDSRVQGLKLGADDYVTKPFNPRELIERVRIRLRSKVETDELRAMQETIRTTFERFVAPSVVEQLLRDPTQVKLGGTLQQVTVMFVGLEGFTTIAEHTEPEQILNILNAYHALIVGAIRDHGGTADRFMSDCMMALYNAPLPQANHAERAAKTALYIRRNLSALTRQFEPLFRMPLNFGIHTGTAIVGNVGAPDMMNYTAVGDTVNLAAQLHTMSRGGRILISEATCRELQDAVPTTCIGLRVLKGRADLVLTHEIHDS
ncbi:MAG: response regulator [Anaerolineae bacterium]|nr:response regulator [Anaerolineae bacterium]